MLKQIKNQIKNAALVAPVLATDTTINLTAPSNFATLGNNLTVGSMVSGAISLVLVVITVVFFFILVLGGLKWITSGGDEKKVAAARGQITNALIGLAIVFASWAIIKLIESIFGISIINNLTIKGFTN